MAYCTTAQVTTSLPTRTFSATSKPTTTEIGELIDRIAGEIDVVLGGRGLTVPVTTPDELVVFLEQLNILGASSLTEQAMFPETAGQMSAPAAKVLWNQYRQGLKFLMEGELTSTGSTPLAFSFQSENEGNATEPSETHAWQKPKIQKNKEW